MYSIISNGVEIALCDTPHYIKKNSSNIWVDTTVADAQAVVVNGTQYNMPGKNTVPGAATAIVIERDGGDTVFKRTASTYIATTQNEFNAALSQVRTTGGKIILREGSFSCSDSISGKVIIEGMGAKTTLNAFNRMSTYGDLMFANLQLNANVKGNTGTVRVINCTTTNGGNDALFECADLYVLGGSLSNTDIDEKSGDECYSGIVCSGKVKISDCDVTLDSGSGSYISGYDVNLVYKATEANLSGCTITCKGTQNTNIVYQGKANISGGCHIYLLNDKASICHTNTSAIAEGIFTGNYVEYYKTYMRFGAITGNVFNHKAAGTSSSNQIILQCPTCMCDNHFTGSAVYVDGQSKKHIIDRNLSDNALTVGSTASGSINTNNLQY